MSDPAKRLAETLSFGSPLPEGMELPPSGVRTMAVLRWALVALMAVAAATAWIHWAATRSHEMQSAARYRCPMHPSVVQERAGECPICGMDLVLLAPVQPRHHAAGGLGGEPSDLMPVEIRPERTQLMGIRTAKVTRQPLAAQLRTIGFVVPDESSVHVVSTRFPGWVEQLLVAQTGERVRKGQLLATVSGPELATAQEIYLAMIERERRQNAPAARGGTSADRKALARLGMAEEDMAELAKRGQPFNAMPIRAPVSGYVAKRSALAGLYVQPGSELFQIADLSTVWVVADVYEQDVGRIQVGERARISLAAYPGESFTGAVQFIYPALNQESRTLQARIELKNPALRFRPGMYADVVIDVPPVDALSVPSDAVVDTGEQQYVFVAHAGGRFEPRTVRLGAAGDGRRQVLEGLAEDEVVVTTANFLIDSESRLRAAVEALGAPPAAGEEKGNEAAKVVRAAGERP